MRAFLISTAWFIGIVLTSSLVIALLSFILPYDLQVFFLELVSGVSFFVIIFALLGFFRLTFHPIQKWYHNLFLLVFTVAIVAVMTMVTGMQGALGDIYKQQHGFNAVPSTSERFELAKEYALMIQGKYVDDAYLAFSSIEKGDVTYYYNMDLARAEEAILALETLIVERESDWEQYFGVMNSFPEIVVFYEHSYQLPNENANVYGLYQPYSDSIHVPIQTNIGEESFDLILAHEYIHHLTYSLFDDPDYVPEWFVEGISVALENEERAIEFDPRFEVANFRELQHERGWNKHLEYPYHIYHQTGTLLNSLLKQQGDDFLQRLAAHMYEIPLEEAFEVIVGESLDDYTSHFFTVYEFAGQWLHSPQTHETIEERKNHLRDIIKTIPHAVQAYEQLGTIYLEEGHTYLAVGAYNQALQLDPTNIHRYYYVSTAYLVDNLSMAIQVMEEGLSRIEHPQYHAYLDLLYQIDEEMDDDNPYKAYYQFIQSGYFSSEREQKWFIEAILTKYDDVVSEERMYLEVLLEELPIE
ncbi:tetratricopeptide repeat protein [Alkalihalobacillus pseudalcaliphilus]|uniref:tetratricopeptide repeat protein n=1 Tax=Alkalihalobacillus pseudalcaliphilus TaxID=79884 RepID=UPI00064DFEE0|nr:hypothetical protein [Alkalihalobacillus pseudalcaliphilus]KMK75860.1 hypothetical protein AB990_11395 [Alkalihalobacillus pseudalcaliphilus]